MAQFGQFALALAFIVSIYSIIASVVGIRFRNDKLIASGRNAAVGVCVSITASIASLAYLFLTDNFAVEYVAGHSNRDLLKYFKVSSIWGGMEGSLLLWGWMLTVYAACVVIQNRKKHTSMMPYVTAVLMSTSLFFTALNLFVVNPFTLNAVSFPDGTVNLFTPADGQGLNPLLQDYWMAIHPPNIYLGFVGFAVPFAFAMAALITKQLGDTWIRTARRWTMIAWGFLGIGIIMGGNWAYHELGWGGFWAWDPVENASLMPWLIGTAYLHSVMVQEKKGMLKVWNIVLVVMAFVMSVYGTFLTRSGIVSSVHAFAQSNIGGYFLAFLTLVLASAGYLLYDRLSYLKADSQMESFVSRESSFLFNNLILLVACFAVFSGTMFPVLSEWVTGIKITVGAPFFNSINVPIAIFLMFLTGVGPLLAWRKASTNSLKRNFMIPAEIALCIGVVLYFAGVRHFYAWMALVMSAFVACTIAREFYKGARARAIGTGENFAQAIVNLTLRNTRRYGGYLAHFSFVLLFVGWSGQAFSTEIQQEAGIGDTFNLRQYTLRVEELTNEDTPNYSAQRAKVSLYEKGVHIADMFPERRFYKNVEQPTTEVAIHSTLKEDLYLVFGGANLDGSKAILQLFYNPLTMWVWIGAWVLALGTIICLLPNKKSPPSKHVAKKAPTQEGADIEHVVQ